MKRQIFSLRRTIDAVVREMRFDRKTRWMIDKWVEEKGFCKVCSVVEAAEDMGLSHKILKDYFARKMRYPFATWRKKLRLKEVRRLLSENPAATLPSICASVGIPCGRNLRRQFEEEFGQTLSHYRSVLQKRK